MRKLFVRSAAALAIAAALPSAGCKSSPGPSIEVRIPLADATPTLKHATVVVDYTRSGARPQIAGGSPSCTSILPHVSCRFSDADGKLTIEAESPQGFSGPVDLAVCRMVPDSPGTDAAQIAGRLRIEIADARGSDGQPIADTKLASKRDSSGAAGPAEAVPGSGPAGDGGGRQRAGGADTAASAAPGAGAAGATGQGLVVTQDDLAAREQRRAEEQMKARDAQKKRDALSGQAAPGIAPGGSTGAVTAGEEEAPLGEEPGTGVNDATDDDPKATAYTVRLDLAATSGPVGALQIEVNYHGGSGGWLGAGGGVACAKLAPAAMHACNDPRGGLLKCGFVDTAGFTGPTPLLECTFKSRNSVAAGDFSVDVVDVSSPSMEPMDARVVVAGVYAR